MKALSFSVFFFLALTVTAQGVPPFANITSVEFRGTGCDAESARVAMTPDLAYISVLYDRFSVEVGSGTINPMANMAQKNCVIIVKFDLPAGWSLQFDAVEYRGFVSLPNANTLAQQVISVETLGGKGRNFTENIMRGPKMENFVTVYNNSVVNSAGTQMINRGNQMISLFGGMDPGGGRGQGDGRGGFGGGMGPGSGRGPGDGRGGQGDGRGPGGGGMGPGDGRGPDGHRRHIRSGDFFDCSDKVQQGVLRIRSRIGVQNAGDSTNPTIKMVVDSTDASFNQKLKINWNKCIID